MAAIREKRGKLFIDYHVGGKRMRKAVGLTDTRENRKKAEVLRKQIEYEVASGVMVEKLKKQSKKALKFLEGFEEFKKSRLDIKKSTIKCYQNAVDKFVEHVGNILIKEINEDVVRNFERKIRSDKVRNESAIISGNSIASYINRLNTVYNFFIKQEFTFNKNPFDRKEIKIKDIVTIPDKDLDDILTKLKYKNQKHYKLISFLLLTGLRRGEVIGLTFENNVDFRENILTVINHKRNRIDKLPLYEELKDFLITEWEDKRGLLFDYKSSESLKFFEKFLRSEGYENYSFHTLRKTFISKLINSGMSVYDVMTLARHKDIKTTLKHYSAADLNRMGKEISTRTNLGTILGTRKISVLKIVKLA